MFDQLPAALPLVFNGQTLLTIAVCGAFGLFVGAVPGLSATMATAMLVPLTFFMPPVTAIAAIVTTAAMAIFASDIPAAMIRIPGTAASAAYVHEMHEYALQGRVGRALGISVVCSCIGGIVGTVILMLAAPQLAEVSLNFTSFEYFWLALLGLSAGVMLGTGSVIKGLLSLAVGLLIAMVGQDPASGHPRFTFDQPALIGGVSFVPALIGMFAIPEVIRTLLGATHVAKPKGVAGLRTLFDGLGGSLWKYRINLCRGSLIGTTIGILPGAGSDIGSWIAYATAKMRSKTPERFGKGHDEGLVEACSANNAALSGAYVPALVFGIPGDSITAIVIGVLYMKGLNPGPMIFINSAPQVLAIFLVFLLANLLLIPFGLLAIRAASKVLLVSKLTLAPLILVFCIVGSYAIDASASGIVIMLAMGMLAYLMEENGFPVAPTILGIVMGGLVERSLTTSLIKSDGSMLAFFERPIAGGLGVFTLALWCLPMLLRLMRRSGVVAGKGIESVVTRRPD